MRCEHIVNFRRGLIKAGSRCHRRVKFVRTHRPTARQLWHYYRCRYGHETRIYVRTEAR